MISVNRGTVFQQIDRLYQGGTLAGLGDGQLLERYLTQGDEAAFEALIDVHGPMVLGLCRRVLRDPRDIEDAFQATFLILVRRAPTIRDRSLLSNWLYGVAYRVARRVRAQTLRRRNREIGVENLEAPAIPETSDRLEPGSVLDQELNRLPRKYRVPLILCYLNGRTHDQAAEEMACPVGTVRSRLARGRDLLRRRLTTRGHAPTAAILGTGTTLPARMFGESVPPYLASSTLKAALEISASQTIQAGALSTSALTLTQGVLTTMKLAQLKFVGIAILATSMSAGGLIAVSYAAGQGTKGAPDVNGVAESADGPQEKTVVAPFDGVIIKRSDVEERLKGLENKLEELLRRSSASYATTEETPSTSKVSTKRKPASPQQDDDARRPTDPQHRSIQELEAQLKLAIESAKNTELLFKRAVISRQEWEQSRGQVALMMAMLEGLDDDLTDDIDRLKLEIETKRAEREKANAQTEVAMSVVARNTRLNDRKQGMISAEDVAKGQWEMKTSSAQIAIVDAEIAEIHLRVQQLERRRTRVREVIKTAKSATVSDPNIVPGTDTRR
jgi:RNA polymerase sigma factor (sigma-70 family)